LTFLGAALVLIPVVDQLAQTLDADRLRASWVLLVGGVLSALFVVVRLWDLIQALQRKAVQLAALARRDGLTGVANRRTWDHELSRACALARDNGTSLSVAVLDMDHFKRFNDTHGHVLGDLVLKETAAAWDSILHGRGFLARYGGEEFAVLLPQSSPADATAVLERLRHSVSHSQSCSIGVAEWDEVESPAHLFARADEALYQAKREGRDRIAVHDGSTTHVVAEGASDLDSYLESPRPVFQPIVDLRTGQTVAYEALSRFNGHDAADVFMTVTKEGRGPALEAAAIRAALAVWDGPEPLSINVSLTSLLTVEVQEALPAELSRIILEITERDVVEYTPEAALMLESLRGRGARIAIDDFGVGFSNIERLATLRPDIIKLDKSLVQGVQTNRTLQAVLAACVVLARQMNAEIVAEGVETPADRDFLIGVGVTLAQGYLFGYPEARPARAAVLPRS
jgi:diguanylate cyclase (GGDEF)-like protein